MATFADSPSPLVVKDGYLTTEFWGKIVIQGLVIVNAMLVRSGKAPLNLSPEFSASLVGLMEMGYQAWRSSLKKSAITGRVQVEQAKSGATVALANNLIAQRASMRPAPQPSPAPASLPPPIVLSAEEAAQISAMLQRLHPISPTGAVQ